MNAPLAREFRLSFQEGLGIRCGADGAFVGDVGLLERIDDEWAPRETPMNPEASQAFLFEHREKWAPGGPPPGGAAKPEH